MTHSNRPDDPPLPPGRDRQARYEAIRRWVRDIETHDPDVWGPHLNRLVDSQLASARQSDVPLEVRKRVDEVGTD